MSVSRSTVVRLAAVGATALVAVALVMTSLGPWQPAVRGASPAPNADTSGGITVSGLGTITLTPDLATIVIGVQSQASTAAKAQSSASTAMNRVIAAMGAQGVADVDMKTQWVSLQPQYDYRSTGSARTITGYLATQSLSIKVRKIATTGAVIDAAVAAGATQVSGIGFSIADQTAATAQARTAAMKDARQRAEDLAKAAGVTLGALRSVTESVSSPPIRYYGAADLAAPEAQTTVQPGTTDVSVSVQATFAIG